jgi:hypothetical protein
MKAKKPATKKPATKKPAAKRKPTATRVNTIGMTAAEARRMKEQEAKWQAQEDLRILRNSQEILVDPQRMKRAQALADEEMKALKAVIKK